MIKKPNIYKLILKKLAGKQAVPFENLKDGIEISKEKYAITRSLKNLTAEGFVECFDFGNQQYFRLTNKGKKKLNQINLEGENILVSTAWDGYWRIVLLYLPEERKSERDALRYLLKKAGFVCLKNSVWISMYPFEYLFTNIKKDLNLSTELIIIVTDKVDKETEKEFFSLCNIKTE